jgi:sulfate permease, SulP family
VTEAGGRVIAATPKGWHLFVPKTVTVLRQGYGWGDLRSDVIAGLTVAIVALPLAMALGIASGTTPDKGLVTAVVAGFLISALGGSRFQIGGPTGAFVVVVFNVIARHGYDGMVLATLMAGLMLMLAGWGRLGTWIKYIPEPVVTGFTAGIAMIIFSSQVKDLLGLGIDQVPADFLDKWQAFWAARDTVSLASVGIAGGALALIVAMRRYAPKLPAFLIAVVAASAAVWAFGLPVATIGSRFGGIPSTLPMPAIPEIGLARVIELLPSAFTIAFLAGVESLLSAVVADGMSGRRHRSNCELVGQGIANAASALFGGMPATGAIARTATNIRAGARSPVSGMLHAVFVLLFMVVFGDLAAFIPLASLAAVLVIVAWNMSEVHKFGYLLSAPWGDRAVLLATFALTVLVDLTVAIEVGVVLAAILFMHRMSAAVEIASHTRLLDTDTDDFAQRRDDTQAQRRDLPSGVEVYKFHGPLFFGVASHLDDMLDALPAMPRRFILRMRQVPMLDASGVVALTSFIRRCNRAGCEVLLTGTQPAPMAILRQMGLADRPGAVRFLDSFEAALAEIRRTDAAAAPPPLSGPHPA